MMRKTNKTDRQAFAKIAVAGRRQSYNSPGLIDHGQVRDVTLGGSDGTEDSFPTNTKPQ